MDRIGRLGIYIDFDNLYGACLDYLGIKARQEPDNKQEEELEYFKHFLSSLLLRLNISRRDLYPSSNYEDFKINYVKAFAEFENLPHSSSVNVQQILSAAGVKIITPFYVKAEKTKNKNASDIQLALEIATDFSVKRLNIDAIAIVSGDIDMYPVISWFKEHVGGEVYLLSLKNRLNSVYSQSLNHSIHISYMDNIFAIVEADLEKLGFNLKNKKAIENVSESQKGISDLDTCLKFIEKTLEGLQNWLKMGAYVSTGLIIKNWLPRWDLNIDEAQANNCLKHLIKMGILEGEGIIFELESEDEKLIKGIFYLSQPSH